MRNIIAGISTLIIVVAMGYVASQGGAYNGGEAGKVIEDIAKIKAKKIAFRKYQMKKVMIKKCKMHLML